MKAPKYELVKGMDGCDDIIYNGDTIRIHEVSFTEPTNPTERCVMNVNYDIIDGCPIQDDEFKNAMGDIALDVMEKHLAIKEIKTLIAERKAGGT